MTVFLNLSATEHNRLHNLATELLPPDQHVSPCTFALWKQAVLLEACKRGMDLLEQQLLSSRASNTAAR